MSYLSSSKSFARGGRGTHLLCLKVTLGTSRQRQIQSPLHYQLLYFRNFSSSHMDASVWVAVFHGEAIMGFLDRFQHSNRHSPKDTRRLHPNDFLLCCLHGISSYCHTSLHTRWKRSHGLPIKDRNRVKPSPLSCATSMQGIRHWGLVVREHHHRSMIALRILSLSSHQRTKGLRQPVKNGPKWGSIPYTCGWCDRTPILKDGVQCPLQSFISIRLPFISLMTQNSNQKHFQNLY